MNTEKYTKHDAKVFIEGAKWALNGVGKDIGSGGAGRAFQMACFQTLSLIEELEKHI
jgi:hypothetical protein